MNKKGFTLIELLAVIVILAIIMVIAVPQILNVIDSSRTSAWNNSVGMIKKSIQFSTNTIEPLTGNYKYTVKDLCNNETSSDKDVTDIFNQISDVGDMTLKCKKDTDYIFTLTGKNQFNGKSATLRYKIDGQLVSSDSQEGGSSGENSEPEEHWDVYISPTQLLGGPSVPSGETIWLQKNNTTNNTEVCAVFPNGTLCFNETDFNVDKNGRAISGDKTTAFTQKVTNLGGSVLYINGDANISAGDKICTYSLSTYGCTNNEYTYSCFNNYGNISCKDER